MWNVGDASEQIGEPGLRTDSLSFAVMISIAMTAARSAPRSQPAKSQDLRPRANPRSTRLAALFVRQMRLVDEAGKPVPAAQHGVDRLGEDEFENAARAAMPPTLPAEVRSAPSAPATALRALSPLMPCSMSNNASMRLTASTRSSTATKVTADARAQH